MSRQDLQMAMLAKRRAKAQPGGPEAARLDVIAIVVRGNPAGADADMLKAAADLADATTAEERAAIIARVRLTNEALADELAAKFGG